MIASDAIVLPDPDSPTSPRISPASTANETSRKRSISLPSTPTVRPCTSKRLRAAPPELVADEVERHHGKHDETTGEQSCPPLPRDDVGGAFGHHDAPLRCWRSNPHAEESETGHSQDRPSGDERGLHERRSQRVGKYVAKGDAPRPVARQSRAVHVLHFALAECFGPSETYEVGGIGDDHRDHHVGDGVSGDCHEDQGEDEAGKREDDIGEPHDALIDPCPPIPGDNADDGSNDHRGDCDYHADRQVEASGVNCAGEHVATELVRSEQVVS